MTNAMIESVADGKVVSIHYTLKDGEGVVLDSSAGSDPLTYLHGADNIVPGLERELAGKQVGDKFVAVVGPEDGYGTRSGPGPQPIPRSAFPEDAPVQPGMQFGARGPSGDVMALWVVAVEEEQVFVDNNHPLAGVTLHFDIEVSAIRTATDEEMEHGHPHGADGDEEHDE
jgi:FKBP-type peptidyl-prolyl cis-trans isomerase SlyD